MSEKIEYVITPSSPEEKVQQIVDKWCKILLLNGWKITWGWEEAMGIDGEITVHTNEQEAEMRLKPSVVQNYSYAQKEALILHELIEIVTHPIYDYLEPWISSYLPLVVHSPFCEGLGNVAMNRVVDNLVRILMGQS